MLSSDGEWKMWGPGMISDVGRGIIKDAKAVLQFKLFMHLVIIEDLLRARTPG